MPLGSSSIFLFNLFFYISFFLIPIGMDCPESFNVVIVLACQVVISINVGQDESISILSEKSVSSEDGTIFSQDG